MNTKIINTENATIEWVGKKILGSHNGTIEFKEGFYNFVEDQLVGGEFLVDMTTITVTDLSGDMKNQLEGHLHSDDFFSTANFDTSKLAITNATKKGDDTYEVQADLTIKGQTHPVDFELKIAGNTATTEFKIDRTKYGIRYGSGNFFSNLGDNTISDKFTLKISQQL